MKVSELIAALREMPQDAAVMVHYDGSPYGSAGACWLTRGGRVSIGDLQEPVYDLEHRSAAAPDDKWISVRDMPDAHRGTEPEEDE